MEKLELVKSTIKGYFDDLGNDSFNRFRDDFSFGKMLRSKLVFAIAPDSAYSVKLCAIIELIHFASLLHDDVIDDSTLRRGKISINAKYGNKNAIMLGDILYSKAFYEISTIDSNLSKIIADSVLKLSLGELEDVELSLSFNLDENKYLKMIEYKTAALIEASSQCAGILIGDNSDKYKIYGNCIGIAFQIIDDILDVTYNDDTLGKNSFSDLKEGKATLPYIYLYKKMNKQDQDLLLSLFKKELDSKEISWIKQKIQQYSIINDVKEVVKKYANKALSVLESQDLQLELIMKDMLDRNF
ncbi:polyprenyl synthetase family protein [Helicobacter sp. MIT 99-5507]|uniref:polyprenyl synthetase family protein n=1 Tax=Helicobacter sp. MIT 99-5507 TaxID=152489 RepID=UPI0011C05E26|nr:polyprenyl synthetase family protein [Helicobacter sp. MIT 99-5507]